MFRIITDPSSGSFIQCLAKIIGVAPLDCGLNTQCFSRLCSTHTVPLQTVQYKHSASLDCAVNTQCLSRLNSKHKLPPYTVQYTHSASLDCALQTQCLSRLCSKHTVTL